MHYDLQESLKSVILNIGDIIIDTFSGYTGMLLKREHRIDMMDDDMYFWEIKWMTNVERDDLKPNHARIRLSDVLEEECTDRWVSKPKAILEKVPYMINRLKELDTIVEV